MSHSEVLTSFGIQVSGHCCGCQDGIVEYGQYHTARPNGPGWGPSSPRCARSHCSEAIHLEDIGISQYRIRQFEQTSAAVEIDEEAKCYQGSFMSSGASEENFTIQTRLQPRFQQL